MLASEVFSEGGSFSKNVFSGVLVRVVFEAVVASFAYCAAASCCFCFLQIVPAQQHMSIIIFFSIIIVAGMFMQLLLVLLLLLLLLLTTTTISTIAITAATKKSTSTTAMETATLHEIELQPFQQKTMRIEYWPLAVDASHVQRIEPYSTLAVDVRQETAYYTSP